MISRSVDRQDPWKVLEDQLLKYKWGIQEIIKMHLEDIGHVTSLELAKGCASLPVPEDNLKVV